jgi:CheY-like chemotaxis protein/predicted transcriptional regulator
LPSRGDDSYSNAVIRRILQVLAESGPLNKTRLAGKAGINYGACTKYLQQLVRLQWAETEKSQEDSELVSITTEGLASLSKLQDEKIPSASPSSLQRSGSISRANVSAAVEASTRRARANPMNIIIVDDDERSLITYAAYLEQVKDYRVRTFSDSRKALEFLTLHPNSYDLIMLDIRMPGMSGLRLFQGIRASNPNAKVIFLSSLDAGPELSEIFSDATQPSTFLRKPVTRSRFLEAISRARS